MNQNPAPEADNTPEQAKARQEKRVRLFTDGYQAYSVALAITSITAEIREEYSHPEVGDETQDKVDIAGRAMLARNGDKLCFVTFMDGEDSRIQTMLSAAEVGPGPLTQYKADADSGDHLFIHGRMISSRRGELFVLACPGTAPAGLLIPGIGEDDPVPAWQIATKSIRPLPKTYTAEDSTEAFLLEDMRVWRRYLDMIVQPVVRDMARACSKVVKSLRDYFDETGLIEIETPMLQNLYGGAVARPFPTHMNTYDTDLFLRIAPEFFPKRAVVGGIDKVFEIDRNFRNEGADSPHSLEFVMLEVYGAYGSYDTMARRTRGFVQKAARGALGIELATLSDGSLYDPSGSWAEISMFEAVAEALGREFNVDIPPEELVKIAEELGEDVADHWSPGKVTEVIFEAAVGDKLWVPTFVRDRPEDFNPLMRGHHSKKGTIEKWDLYVRGFELATVYSELVDPAIQCQRFEAQALTAANGDPEMVILDEDFLMAMEYGMPPAGGMGMGLDHLLMALTGHGIHETITFPFMKKL